MISESFYWKSDLLRQAQILVKRMKQKRWPDASFARCEQTIMLGFYSIRKLMESTLLTDRTSKLSVPLCSYSPTGRAVHLMDKDRLGKLYDFDKRKKQTISLTSLCNQVIHSYIFTLLFNEDGYFAGILVASDRQRSKGLLEASIDRIIDIFETVGKDDVKSASMFFDESKGDCTYVYRR